MSKKFQNLQGERFERWLVLRRAPNRYGDQTYWTCLCDCGTERDVSAQTLSNGGSRSCGCWRRENPNRKTHGLAKTREHRIWSNMIYRCHTPTSKQWRFYGGRGITVCAEWRTSFQRFLDDMGAAPEKYTLERINNNSGYSKENCCWADRKTQARNTRRTRLILHGGKTLSLAEWSEKTGIPRGVIQQRMAAGWTPQEALETPPSISSGPKPRESRRHPRSAERVASALLHIRRGEAWLIPEPLRTTGTAEEICAYVDWDHIIPHAIGGKTTPQNLQPLPRREHRQKSVKIDIPRIAKGKRVARAHAAHQAAMAAKGDGAPELKRTRFSNGKKWRRKLNGQVVPR